MWSTSHIMLCPVVTFQGHATLSELLGDSAAADVRGLSETS